MSVSADIIHLSNKMDLNDAVIFVYPFIWQVDDIKKKEQMSWNHIFKLNHPLTFNLLSYLLKQS